MSKYKILGENSDRVSVANSDGGRDTFRKGHWKYDIFLREVKEQGIGIVEGPEVVTPDYKQQRLTEYPSLTDQQDMQYWDAVNGTTTWKDKINEIKTKYPKTNTGSTTVGDVPSWVQTEVDKLNS